jgi:hypothetical protein
VVPHPPCAWSDRYVPSAFPPLRSLKYQPLPVIWTKDNPTPWNDIKQDENTKLINVNQKFEREYVLSCDCQLPLADFITAGLARGSRVVERCLEICLRTPCLHYYIERNSLRSSSSPHCRPDHHPLHLLIFLSVSLWSLTRRTSKLDVSLAVTVTLRDIIRSLRPARSSRLRHSSFSTSIFRARRRCARTIG